MTTHTYQYSRQLFGSSTPKVTLDHYDVTHNSARVAGKLVLTPQVHAWQHRRLLEFTSNPAYAFRDIPQDASVIVYDLYSGEMTNLMNNALAKFTGKVRKHNASLGVTLGSMHQSKQMLIDRTHKIASVLDKEVARAERRKRKLTRREAIQARAGDILEVEFGWMPAVMDVRDALGALARSPPDGWMTARSKGKHTRTYVETAPLYSDFRRTTWEGDLSASVSGLVRVSNPNEFLLSRLGLLSLPGVAWDLIPWSYVVNMFTNMNQMVNSFTDFVGVEMLSSCHTRTSSVTRTDYKAGDRWGGTPGSAMTVVHEKRRDRDLGLPSPKFELRLPELNLELAVIASSLILQRINKLNRLFGMYER